MVLRALRRHPPDAPPATACRHPWQYYCLSTTDAIRHTLPDFFIHSAMSPRHRSRLKPRRPHETHYNNFDVRQTTLMLKPIRSKLTPNGTPTTGHNTNHDSPPTPQPTHHTLHNDPPDARGKRAHDPMNAPNRPPLRAAPPNGNQGTPKNTYFQYNFGRYDIPFDPFLHL
jgi:hypothetical protein